MVGGGGAAFSTPLGDPYAAVLARREEAPFGGEQLLCAALEELLIRMIRRGTAPAPAARSREDAGALEQVMDYLSARLDRQLTLEEICQDNLVGRSQLQKLFHTHTGGGVMEYFIGLKMQAMTKTGFLFIFPLSFFSAYWDRGCPLLYVPTPEGYAVPAERTKPWGTAQAALAARNVVDGPFAVINADDYAVAAAHSGGHDD